MPQTPASFDSPTSPSSPSQTPSQIPNTERRLSRLEHLLARFTTFVDRLDRNQDTMDRNQDTMEEAATASAERTPTNAINPIANNPSVTTAAVPSSETYPTFHSPSPDQNLSQPAPIFGSRNPVSSQNPPIVIPNASNLLPVPNYVHAPNVPGPNIPVPNDHVPNDTHIAAIAIMSKQQEWPKFTGTPEDFKGWKNTFISAVSTSELKCLYDESSFELVETCDSQNDRLLYSKIVSSLPANDFFRSEDELRGHGLTLWKALIDKYEPKDTLFVVHKLQSHFLGDLARETDEDLDKYYRRFHDIANRINRVLPNSISTRNIRTRFLVTLGPDYEFYKDQITLGTLDEKWFTYNGTNLKNALREIQANRLALQQTPITPNSGVTIGSYTGHNFTANAMKTAQPFNNLPPVVEERLRTQQAQMNALGERLNAYGEQVTILVQAITETGNARGNWNGTTNSKGTGNSNGHVTKSNRPKYSKYCWSCGENFTHGSTGCRDKQHNHDETATWSDHKGGSTVTLPRE